MTIVAPPKCQAYFLGAIAMLFGLARSGAAQEALQSLPIHGVAANEQLIESPRLNELTASQKPESSQPNSVDRSFEVSTDGITVERGSGQMVYLWRSGESVQLDFLIDPEVSQEASIRLVETKHRQVASTSKLDDSDSAVIGNQVPPGVYELQLLSGQPQDDVRWRKWLSATRLVSRPQLVTSTWPVVVLPPATGTATEQATPLQLDRVLAGPMIRISGINRRLGPLESQDRSWDLWEWNETGVTVSPDQLRLSQRLDSLTSEMRKIRSLGVRNCVLPVDQLAAAFSDTHGQKDQARSALPSQVNAAVAWALGQSEQIGLSLWLEPPVSCPLIGHREQVPIPRNECTWSDSIAFAGFCIPKQAAMPVGIEADGSQPATSDAGDKLPPCQVCGHSHANSLEAPIEQLARAYPAARFIVYDDHATNSHGATDSEFLNALDAEVRKASRICQVKQVGGQHQLDKELTQTGPSYEVIRLSGPEQETENPSPLFAASVRRLLLRCLAVRNGQPTNALPCVIVDSGCLKDDGLTTFCQRFAWVSQADGTRSETQLAWLAETTSPMASAAKSSNSRTHSRASCRILRHSGQEQEKLWVINECPWTTRIQFAVSNDTVWLPESNDASADGIGADVRCAQPDHTPVGPVLKLAPFADVVLCSNRLFRSNFAFRVEAPSEEIVQQIRDDVTLVVENVGLIDSLDWPNNTTEHTDKASTGNSPWKELSSVVPRAALSMGQSVTEPDKNVPVLPETRTVSLIRLAKQPDPTLDTSLLNLGFEEHGSLGFRGWMQSQFPVQSVRMEDRFAFGGEQCLRLTGIESVSVESAAQIPNQSGGWLISKSFACPASGRLQLTLAARASQPTETETSQTEATESQEANTDTDAKAARIKVAIECSTKSGIRSESVRLAVPSDGKWHDDLIKLEITKLQPINDREIRIVIDNVGDTDVWIDSLAIKDYFACRQERQDLQRQAYMAVQGLQRGQFSAAATLLSNPWAGALIRHATNQSSNNGFPVRQPKGKPSWSVVGHRTPSNTRAVRGRPASSRMPSQTAKPVNDEQTEQEFDATERDDQPSVADRLRSWLPSPLRF